MALKISFSGKSTKVVSADEAARIKERLKSVMPLNPRKTRVRDMIRDGLELRRLGDALESEISEAERSDLESAFYNLAAKIRKETAALVEGRTQSSSRAVSGSSTAEATPAREGRESSRAIQPAESLVIRGKVDRKHTSRIRPVLVAVSRMTQDAERNVKKGEEDDDSITPH
ncbi:hypothetical protein [Pseudomonas amygdali]|uniref:hypothetical protein n=1 Tax=Pseudomonas amygdali TaxID=47877 RepID=UPI0005C82FAF|nr:hypothetical protein [Pseudomonas amygdali]KWS82153.1 hypothetical protein AL051_24525 [Pseudomonas amygdali pv. dendropanacis]